MKSEWKKNQIKLSREFKKSEIKESIYFLATLTILFSTLWL